MRQRSWKRIVLWSVVGGIALFALIQLIPYGRDHTNPSVTQEPAWDSPQTRALVKESCFDCHSNETKWWWAADIAPFSWLIQRDVNEGRSKLNFSEWQGQAGWGRIEEVVNSGDMPPAQYTMINSGAKLTDAEKRQLIDGMRATLSAPASPAPSTSPSTSPTP